MVLEGYLVKQSPMCNRGFTFFYIVCFAFVGVRHCAGSQPEYAVAWAMSGVSGCCWSSGLIK